MTIPARAACPSSVVSNPKFDMWSSIHEDVNTTTRETVLDPLPLPPPKPYVHSMMRRGSAGSLSQNSLQVCTESLGSETGSDDCFSDLLDGCFSAFSSFTSSNPSTPCHSPAQSVLALDEDDTEEDDEHECSDNNNRQEHQGEPVKKELLSVNYHCSIGRRSPTRPFPPPLPSISRRDGPCVQMRSYRTDGRLVLQAVPVPSQNYLHCRRTGGRLLLTFIEPTFEDVYPAASSASSSTYEIEQEEDARLLNNTEENQEVTETGEDEEGDAAGGELEEHVKDHDDDGIYGSEEDRSQGDEEAGEEIEVVDRGIVVEVKVSRKPQPLSGGLKVRRSSLVINKFVGGVDDGDKLEPCVVQAAGDNEVVGQGGIGVATAATITEDLDEEGKYRNKMAQEHLSTHVPQQQRNGREWSIPAPASVSSGIAAATAAAVATEEEVVGEWGSGGGRHLCPVPRQDKTRLLYFTSKKPMNRQALLHQVRRCGTDPQRPLFIREPCCIATS